MAARAAARAAGPRVRDHPGTGRPLGRGGGVGVLCGPWFYLSQDPSWQVVKYTLSPGGPLPQSISANMYLQRMLFKNMRYVPNRLK